ncbi:MAG: hypothetical protein K0S58_1359 [Nitrospira sp.]|nr:hypothetical protein [Nitrospira sp.]
MVCPMCYQGRRPGLNGTGLVGQKDFKPRCFGAGGGT